MKKLLGVALFVATGFQGSFAQGLLQQTFGSGANAFTIDFVTIGNPGNAADTTGNFNFNPPGSVSYTYNIGKYEVSREMIDKANAIGGLGITLHDMTNYGGNGANKPATGISWYEAAKFVNYLNISSGSSAAYKFDGSGNFQLWSVGDAGFNPNNLFRNSLARYFLPSTDEWYKSAFGGPSGEWYSYPTGTNTAPTPVSGGTASNTVVYNQSWSAGPADINNAGGLSAWGAMGQGANVWEFTESAWDGINDDANELREVRGGSWGDDRVGYISSSGDVSSYWYTPSNIDQEVGNDFINKGFRVAASSSIPEPSSLSLLALGGLLVALRRRR
jgi:formylglycine-generating enzyme required for sulfatase activity